jgi:hypothetical protein
MHYTDESTKRRGRFKRHPSVTTRADIRRRARTPDVTPKRVLHCRVQATIVNVMTDGPDQFPHGAAPIALARAAVKISATIMDEGFHFVGIAYTVEGDMEKKIAKPAAQFQRSLERCHELFFMGGLEQNVTRIELNHRRKLQFGESVRDVN